MKEGKDVKFQVSTDCAIQILKYLHRNKGELLSSITIAASVGVSYPNFTKIANQLKKKGLLHSVQGRNGGYQLKKPAHEISLYEVFLCMEGDLRINRCLRKERPCSWGRENDCSLHGFLHDLQEKIIAELSGKSVADLAS